MYLCHISNNYNSKIIFFFRDTRTGGETAGGDTFPPVPIVYC